MDIALDPTDLVVNTNMYRMVFARRPPATYRLVEIWYGGARVTHGMHGFLESIDGRWAGGAHGLETETCFEVTVSRAGVSSQETTYTGPCTGLELVTEAVLASVVQRRTTHRVLETGAGVLYWTTVDIEALADHACGTRYVEMVPLVRDAGWVEWSRHGALSVPVEDTDPSSGTTGSGTRIAIRGSGPQVEIGATTPLEWKWSTATYHKIYGAGNTGPETRTAGTTQSWDTVWSLR